VHAFDEIPFASYFKCNSMDIGLTQETTNSHLMFTKYTKFQNNDVLFNSVLIEYINPRHRDVFDTAIQGWENELEAKNCEKL
jgi:hypothetical protein